MWKLISKDQIQGERTTVMTFEGSVNGKPHLLINMLTRNPDGTFASALCYIPLEEDSKQQSKKGTQKKEA